LLCLARKFKAFPTERKKLAVFVDFKGAYDSTKRVKLMDKLQTIGVKWIQNFISQHLCATKFENKLSKYKHIRRGLPKEQLQIPNFLV
jgi:hypothetical protein